MARAPFSTDLHPLRQFLPSLLPVLEAQPGWYGSVYLERKTKLTHTVNLRQSNINDEVSLGVVLRIYDGYTLFEQSSDQLEPEALLQLAQRFAGRVAATPPAAGAIARPYAPVSWSERLQLPLDDEIRVQIPADANATTEVHFGIRCEQDPTRLSNESILGRLKAIVERTKALAPDAGLAEGDLSFVQAQQRYAIEDALFIDRAVNMSQTLYRIATVLVTMSGPHRAHSVVGGLGGQEVTAGLEDKIASTLADLAAVRQAELLTPGQYRVLIGPSIAGVLAHEAFGHSQEGDTCARGRSKAWDLFQSGEIVGNQHATILNNPAIFKNGDEDFAAWGSYFFDEEGWLAQEQVLLEAGQLRAPMTNLTSALRLGVPRSANGKRESWANGVYTRQTNTYFSAGDATLAELMQQLGDGFVATQPAGGMEDPKGMGIQVGIQFLQEVRDGKFTGRVFRGPAGGDVQLTGYTPDLLNAIVAKSKIEYTRSDADEAVHPQNKVGGCGKYHKEIVHAGSGGPYMLLAQATLG